MRRRSFSLIAALAILALAVPLNSATRAQESAQIKGERPKLAGGMALVQEPRGLAQQSGPIKLVIELSDAPTTQVFSDARARGASAQATSEARRQLAQIERNQQTLLRSLQAPTINARVIYRTQRVFNGIAVIVDASKLDQIRQLPGIASIRPLVTKHLDNASSVPLIGAPRLWDDTIDSTTNTGEGIKIGVIDTGIDYIHTDFGGSGTGYDTNDTTKIGDSPNFGPGKKVAGGYDFAGDDYDASDPDKAVPAPDPDPMDCNGHGSHVAGTAAGYGVNANGTTYTGSYGPSTPFDELRIGPGVAPEATLYALRVFGCEGSTDLTDVAIEWAVDPNGDGDFSDHLDVINMSLGSEFGGNGLQDSTVIASDNAAAAGVIVVASAGNSGDTYYVTGSPGTASRVISVASSVDSTSIFDGFRVNSPSSIARVYPSSNAVNYDFANKPPVTGQLVYPSSQAGGCQAFNAENAALLAGKIALLDWTMVGGENECGSATRVTNAANAGAIGVILVYPDTGIDISIAGSSRIPSTITNKPTGDILKANLGAGVSITLSNEFVNSQKIVDPSRVDTLSDFSSRGPRRVDSMLKPDISAPGQTIFSVSALSGNEGTSLNGTSMAAPHVAGSMALLRQLHPSWTVEELKALAMNTATNDVRLDAPLDSQIHGPQRVGAGRITLPNARDAQGIAYIADNSGLVSVSFGTPEVLTTASASKTIRIVNKSSETVTYNLAYTPVVDMPGVNYTLSRSSITLGPGGFGNVQVTMTADGSQMQHSRDATVSNEQVGLARHWLSEESGFVTMTPTSGQKLRIPVYAAPRAASDMQASSSTLEFNPGGAMTNEIKLTGKGLGSPEALETPDATDEVSLVTAYELQYSSPNDVPSPSLIDNADLQYVGVASDFAATATDDAPADMAQTTIAFGISTYGNWSTPNAVEFDIYIDTNRDGKDDYVLFNSDLGTATGGDPSDVFVTLLLDLNKRPGQSGRLTLQSFLNGVPASVLDTVPYNTRVMALPVSAADLGLSNGTAKFNYRIETFSLDNVREDDDQTIEDERIVESTPTLTYDAARPGIDTSSEALPAGVPAYFDLNGATIPVRYNGAAFRDLQSQGVLLLHHHNTSERHAEVVRVTGNFFFHVYLPIVRQ